MDKKKYAFVFAVCGGDEHIQTLNFSLIPLAKRTKYPIYVVTDTSRNQQKINWDTIIDIEAPKEFSNHQAAIYLKTGLHKFLPPGVTYCYLDSDILAIGNFIDNVFNEFKSPIRFALDHCKMKEFAPFAVNCYCEKKEKDYELTVNNLLNSADEFRLSDDVNIIKARLRFEDKYKSGYAKFISRIKTYLQLMTFRNKIIIDSEVDYFIKEKVFKTKEGIVFRRNFNFKKILLTAGYKWNSFKNKPRMLNGDTIHLSECNHLKDAIEKTFKVKVKDPDFSHYNGGMFLFNDESHPFMEYWHSASLKIFNLPFWKIRDQGTLIATVWKMKIEKMPPMSSRWNLIIDYNNAKLNFRDIIKCHLKNSQTDSPQFLHVYHHFNDANWEVWKEIEKML